MKAQQLPVLGVAGILAFFSFAISYTTMEALASDNQIEPACLFPLIIDGVMILALIWRLYGDQQDYARYTMAAYVVLSIGLNAVAHGNPLSAIMAAVAPISMYVTSEIGASMLHQKAQKGTARDDKGRFTKKVE